MNIPYRITPRPIWESPTWTHTEKYSRPKSPKTLDFQLTPSENFRLASYSTTEDFIRFLPLPPQTWDSAAQRGRHAGARRPPDRSRRLNDSQFDPALSAASRGSYFDVGRNLAGVEEHVARLKRAEALVLVFPNWWFGFPTILKGWFDRV
jgi:hypothetical protein